MISVLYEEGFQEVIIERGVVVSYEKELVFFIEEALKLLERMAQ